MSWAALQRLADRLRTVPLESVLRLSGAQPDRYDRHKWHTSQGVLSVNGAQFMNWTRAQGGGGAIDLVMHLHGLGFGTALQWLSQSFPAPWSPAADPLAAQASLRLPPPDPGQLWRVRRYLAGQRALPPALIEPLIRSGTLYADHRANAVFLLLGKEKQPVGAELRGTTPRPWRGLAPGSKKDLGFFAIPPDPRPEIILVESAIDAISCFTLHPEHRCISTAGARPNPRWLAPLLGQSHSVYCGFDADPVGEHMAQAMMALYPTIQRLRPPRQDWNDVLKARA
jgi:hypothetical protein